jgi:hypothetical protein
MSPDEFESNDDDDDEDEEDDSDADVHHCPVAAVVAQYLGATAIYKILQTRPAIYEKQLKRPPPTTSTAPLYRRHQSPPPDSNGDYNHGSEKTRKSIEVARGTRSMEVCSRVVVYRRRRNQV